MRRLLLRRKEHYCPIPCLISLTICPQNGGTNCPACRTTATVAMPFRAIQPVLDSLLRFSPQKTRAEREKQQADEVYKLGHSIRVSHTLHTSFPSECHFVDSSLHPEKFRLHLTRREVQTMFILVPTAWRTIHTTGDALTQLRIHQEMLKMPGILMMEFHLVMDTVATGEIPPSVTGLATELDLQ